ncbi:MAG: hypothetical protein H5T44_05215 [Thermoplasmatales archaeon]|nr:hypothetical protein [Thermoplasmatales archaeon]
MPLEDPPTYYPFEINITLREGANKIKVEATDTSGNLNISAVFQPVQVVWQDAPPANNSRHLREIIPGKLYEATIRMISLKSNQEMK